MWLRGGSPQELAAVSFVINSVLSHNNTPTIPAASPGAVPIAGGRLLRLDLGEICTDEADQANLVATWDRLNRVDDAFSFNIVTTEIVKVDPPLKINGKTFRTQERINRTTGFAAHVAPVMTELSALTGNNKAPIIDARELIRSATTTLEGGLYYRFRRLTPGVTKLKDYLASRGASEQQVEQLESLEKAVVFFSEVSGKERMVAVFRGAGVRASRGGGVVSITFDPFDEDRSDGQSPARNLLNFRGRGHEVIVEFANGFHEWTLWNEAGVLVDVAPQNLVSDGDIPNPHTKNLQPGISCIRCHARDQGWRGLVNDAPKLIAGGTDIFGDLSSAEDQRKQVQLLAGLYSGDWFDIGTGPLTVGRLSYNRVCVEATGVGAREIGEIVSAMYAAYWYDRLDVWDVANEIGIVGLPPSDGDPATVVDQKAAIDSLKLFIQAAPIPGQIAREDANIAAIIAGVEIGRRGWQSSAHIALERAYQRAGK